MQSESKIFEDISKVINGLAGTVAGMGREAQSAFRERSKEWAAGLDFVSREEFNAVKALAANARAEADALGKRVAVLEAAMGIKAKPAAKAAKPSPAKTAPVKKAPAKKAPPKKPAVAKK
jgi:BMFP domain-containing protein YqiC